MTTSKGKRRKRVVLGEGYPWNIGYFKIGLSTKAEWKSELIRLREMDYKKKIRLIAEVLE